MATKSISIDLAAYRRLKKARIGSESLSKTIKRVVPVPIDMRAWMARMAKDPFSDDFIAAVENHVRERTPSTPRRKRKGK